MNFYRAVASCNNQSQPHSEDVREGIAGNRGQLDRTFVPMPVNTNAIVEELMAVPDRVGREEQKTQRGHPGLIFLRFGNFTQLKSRRQTPKPLQG